jgi:hypothetical protein
MEFAVSVGLYCGTCFYDMGILRPLTVFRRWLEKEARYVPGGYACGFCQSERIPGATRLRVREVTALPGKESDEETSVRIPHVVNSAGKAI